MKKKFKIFLAITIISSTVIGISSCVIKKKQDVFKQEVLKQHRELFNNYEEMKYKEYIVYYLGIYDGYIGLFFDEMDKDTFFGYSDYFYKGQLLFYKDGKILKETDQIIFHILKEKTEDRFYLDFTKLKVKQYIFYKNRI